MKQSIAFTRTLSSVFFSLFLMALACTPKPSPILPRAENLAEEELSMDGSAQEHSEGGKALSEDGELPSPDIGETFEMYYEEPSNSPGDAATSLESPAKERSFQTDSAFSPDSGPRESLPTRDVAQRCNSQNCPNGCCSNNRCYPSTVAHCGVAGSQCISCDDQRPETIDICSAKGICIHRVRKLTSLLPDPGMTSPRLRFHTGRVVNNAPELFKIVPNMPGYPVSDWYVAQWAKQSLMRPDVMFINAPSTKDPLLGVAKYAFPAAKNYSHLWIYERKPKPPIFELHSEHGWLSPRGGSNVFLAVNAAAGVAASMEKKVILYLEAKLKKVVEFAYNPANLKNGRVMWQFFIGMSFHFVHPQTKKRTHLFLQIKLGNSIDSKATYLSHTSADGLIYGGILPGSPFFTAPHAAKAPLQALQYDINRYLCAAVKARYPSQVIPSGYYSFPKEAHHLKNWLFRGFYIGLETQSGLASDRVLLGAAAATVQLSNIRLMRDDNALSPFQNCP